MKEPEFYIKKADELIYKINKYQEGGYIEKISNSLKPLVLEVELLFFGYSENYPSLLDIRQLKERHGELYYDNENSISNNVILLLSMFRSFIIDHYPCAGI